MLFGCYCHQKYFIKTLTNSSENADNKCGTGRQHGILSVVLLAMIFSAH